MKKIILIFAILFCITGLNAFAAGGYGGSSGYQPTGGYSSSGSYKSNSGYSSSEGYKSKEGYSAKNQDSALNNSYVSKSDMYESELFTKWLETHKDKAEELKQIFKNSTNPTVDLQKWLNANPDLTREFQNFVMPYIKNGQFK